MIQNKLSQSQIEDINGRFQNHPLLITCRLAFECYNANLHNLFFAPEEIFLETALILDRLLIDPKSAEGYINELWNKEKIKIRGWQSDAQQDDLNNITGAILYVVAAVLCQHYHRFYNDKLKDMILDVVRKNMHPDTVEEKRIIRELSRCADGLHEWLFEYSKSDYILSEDIMAPKQKQKSNHEIAERPIKLQKAHEPMTLMRGNSVTDGHLTLLHQALIRENWIDCNEITFKDLFSGKRNKDCLLTWTAKNGKSTLVELFKQLINAGLVFLPNGYSLSNILEGHFIDINGEYLNGLGKGNKPNVKALPFIKECVKLLETDPTDHLNSYRDDNYKETYDPYDHNLRIRKR